MGKSKKNKSRKLQVQRNLQSNKDKKKKKGRSVGNDYYDHGDFKKPTSESELQFWNQQPSNRGFLADLHVHTDVPDSFRPFDDVLNEALKRRVLYLGITDHNYTGSEMGVGKYCRDNNVPYDQVIVKAYDGQLNIIPGTEVNCRHKGAKFHLTVFGANRDPEVPFNKYIKMEYDRTFMLRNVYFTMLNEFGFNITREEIQRFYIQMKKVDPSMVDFNREHALTFVAKYRTHKELSLAKEILPTVIPDTFTNFHIDGADIIKLAHDAGGIVIWAHPKFHCKHGDITQAFNSLVEHGLDGHEAYTKTESLNNRLYDKNKHKASELLISAGSDKHFDNRPLGRFKSSSNVIYAQSLTVIPKLEEMNLRVQNLDLQALNEEYKQLNNRYEPTLRKLEIEFMRGLLLRSNEVYKKHFGVEIKDYLKNDDFCHIYFKYLTSSKVGEAGLSPVSKIAEMEQRLNVQETAKSLTITNHEEYIKNNEAILNLVW